MQSWNPVTAVLAAVVALSTAAATPPTVERYVIDTARSHVGFTVRHLGVRSVSGEFTRFGGELMIDQTDITRSSVTVTIEAATIDTRNERRDEHLRSADFFEVERFPTLSFTSTRIEEAPGGLVVVGDLQIRDVTQQVRIPIEVSGPGDAGNGQKRFGASGELVIDRFDYGLQYNRFQEALQVVGDEVRIELDVEASTPRQP